MDLPLCYAQDTERKKRDGDGFAFMLCPRYSKSLSPTASTTNRLRENVTFLYHNQQVPNLQREIVRNVQVLH